MKFAIFIFGSGAGIRPNAILSCFSLPFHGHGATDAGNEGTRKRRMEEQNRTKQKNREKNKYPADSDMDEHGYTIISRYALDEYHGRRYFLGTGVLHGQQDIIHRYRREGQHRRELYTATDKQCVAWKKKIIINDNSQEIPRCPIISSRFSPSKYQGRSDPANEPRPPTRYQALRSTPFCVSVGGRTE